MPCPTPGLTAMEIVQGARKYISATLGILSRSLRIVRQRSAGYEIRIKIY
jgi:hypothetical protein